MLISDFWIEQIIDYVVINCASVEYPGLFPHLLIRDEVRNYCVGLCLAVMQRVLLTRVRQYTELIKLRSKLINTQGV